MSKWEFPDGYAIPIQYIRDDEGVQAVCPLLPTFSDEEVKRWYTEYCNQVWDRCPVIVVDFTVPPWTPMEECVP